MTYIIGCTKSDLKYYNTRNYVCQRSLNMEILNKQIHFFKQSFLKNVPSLNYPLKPKRTENHVDLVLYFHQS